MSWRSKAACLGHDTELFFPAGCTGPAQEQAEQAVAICRQCPVITQCLDWAVTTGQDDGIWGGLTEDQRRALRRSRTQRRIQP